MRQQLAATAPEGHRNGLAIGRPCRGRVSVSGLGTRRFGSDQLPQANDRGPPATIYLRRAVEASLRRLRPDGIDLYDRHHWGGMPPIGETRRAGDDLVRQGKVCDVGASG